MFTILLSLITITYLTFYYIRWKFLLKFHKISGPFPLPFIGSTFHLIRFGYKNSIRQWSECYGEKFGYLDGYQFILILDDKQTIEKLFVGNFQNCFHRKSIGISDYLKNSYYSNIFSSNYHNWQLWRGDIARTMFFNKKRFNEKRITEKYMRILLINLLEKNSEELIDIQKISQIFSFDVIEDFIQSKKNYSYLTQHFQKRDSSFDKLHQFANELTKLSNFFTCLLNIFPILQYLFVLPILDFLTFISSNIKNSNLHQLINERCELIRSGEAPNDLLTEMIKKRYHFTSIKSNLAFCLIAGYETSGSLLTFSIYRLCKNEKKQEELFQLILQKFNKQNLLSYENVNEFEELNNFLNDTMKEHSTAPSVISRKCSKTIILDNQLSIYHNTIISPNVKLFENNSIGNFGMGRRRCPASKFALISIKTFLIYFIRTFRFEITTPLPNLKSESIIEQFDGEFLIRLFSRLK
ncbi:hypothetical protein SNEBB_003539 [Seison nebaliae]|nr:hypothetical protein SNEBB_003539 [Seison nebaliae]